MHMNVQHNTVPVQLSCLDLFSSVLSLWNVSLLSLLYLDQMWFTVEENTKLMLYIFVCTHCTTRPASQLQQLKVFTHYNTNSHACAMGYSKVKDFIRTFKRSSNCRRRAGLTSVRWHSVDFLRVYRRHSVL